MKAPDGAGKCIYGNSWNDPLFSVYTLTAEDEPGVACFTSLLVAPAKFGRWMAIGCLGDMAVQLSCERGVHHLGAPLVSRHERTLP